MTVQRMSFPQAREPVDGTLIPDLFALYIEACRVEIWHLDELPSALPASTLNLHQNEDEK